MNAKNTTKSPIHQNVDANITCDFGDGDISRSRSRFTHTHTCRGCEVRTCDFAPQTEDPIKTPIKTQLFRIFENKLQKWIKFAYYVAARECVPDVPLRLALSI